MRIFLQIKTVMCLLLVWCCGHIFLWYILCHPVPTIIPQIYYDI